MLAKILAKVFNTEKHQNQKRSTIYRENNYDRRYERGMYQRRDTNERNQSYKGAYNIREGRRKQTCNLHPNSNHTSEQCFTLAEKNIQLLRGEHFNNRHRSYQDAYENYRSDFNARRNRKLSKGKDNSNSRSYQDGYEDHISFDAKRNGKLATVAYPSNNNIQKWFIRTSNTRQPKWTAHLNSNYTSENYSKDYGTIVKRKPPIYRINPNGSHMLEKRSVSRKNMYKCSLHPQGGHSKSECKTYCVFCGKKALHLSKDCNLKNTMRQEFIGQNVSKFGRNIEHLTKDSTPAERKMTCSFCRQYREHTSKESAASMPRTKTGVNMRDNSPYPVPTLNCAIADGPYRLKNGIILKKPKSITKVRRQSI